MSDTWLARENLRLIQERDEAVSRRDEAELKLRFHRDCPDAVSYRAERDEAVHRALAAEQRAGELEGVLRDLVAWYDGRAPGSPPLSIRIKKVRALLSGKEEGP